MDIEAAERSSTEREAKVIELEQELQKVRSENEEARVGQAALHTAAEEEEQATMTEKVQQPPEKTALPEEVAVRISLLSRLFG